MINGEGRQLFQFEVEDEGMIGAGAGFKIREAIRQIGAKRDDLERVFDGF